MNYALIAQICFGISTQRSRIGLGATDAFRVDGKSLVYHTERLESGRLLPVHAYMEGRGRKVEGSVL